MHNYTPEQLDAAFIIWKKTNQKNKTDRGFKMKHTGDSMNQHWNLKETGIGTGLAPGVTIMENDYVVELL